MGDCLHLLLTMHKENSLVLGESVNNSSFSLQTKTMVLVLVEKGLVQLFFKCYVVLFWHCVSNQSLNLFTRGINIYIRSMLFGRITRIPTIWYIYIYIYIIIYDIYVYINFVSTCSSKLNKNILIIKALLISRNNLDLMLIKII